MVAKIPQTSRNFKNEAFTSPLISTHFYAGTKQSKYTILSLYTKGEGSFSPHVQVLFDLERWSQAQLHKEWSLLSNLRSRFFYLVAAALKYKLQPIQDWIESPPISRYHSSQFKLGCRSNKTMPLRINSGKCIQQYAQPNHSSLINTALHGSHRITSSSLQRYKYSFTILQITSQSGVNSH